MDPLFGVTRRPTVLGPGAVHVPDWLSREQQQYLLRACVDWAAARPPSHTVLPGGGRMSVRTLSVGRAWSPYRYDDAPGVPGFPDWLRRAGRAAVRAAAGLVPELAESGGAPLDPEDYAPDVALVNFYDDTATMGLHQDKDERSDDPVVSLSLGDDCVFRFGTPERRGRPHVDVRLQSGDLVVFGGPSRLAFHGVPRVDPGTAPGWCAEVLGARPGRVNITLRRSRDHDPGRDGRGGDRRGDGRGPGEPAQTPLDT